ncbi:MAG: DUF3576 domain-containing protein [Pseudomonadota bacterium]|nr:DUF3576 domain-containing protein [Pseudomonadota bacterium]
MKKPITINRSIFKVLLTSIFKGTFLVFVLALGSCEYMGDPFPEDAKNTKGGGYEVPTKQSSIFGEGGLSIGGAKKRRDSGGGSGVGVNAFLWRASLDVASIWPISSADPFGGVIITDWYTPPGAPDEKFKLNIFILDRALRADGIRVTVFKQMLSQGSWKQASVNPKTQTQLENAILTRAQQFRTESLE